MIRIKESKTADTRSAVELVTEEVLQMSSCQHIRDVTKAMYWMAARLTDLAQYHDITKITDFNQFFKDFSACQKDKSLRFIEMEWYQKHINEERHHIDKKPPEDINLFDVLEHIADCVMAGMARTGEVYPETLPSGLLDKAYQNTIKLLKDDVEVEHGE